MPECAKYTYSNLEFQIFFGEEGGRKLGRGKGKQEGKGLEGGDGKIKGRGGEERMRRKTHIM
jgi:hypothetical protein